MRSRGRLKRGEVGFVSVKMGLRLAERCVGKVHVGSFFISLLHEMICNMRL